MSGVNVVKIDLKNPSPKTIALARLFMIIIAVIIIAIILRGYNVKEIRAVNNGLTIFFKGVNQLMNL